MKFMLMIYEDEAILAGRSQNELARVIDGHRGFARSLGARFVHGAGLADTVHAVTVSTKAGKTAATPGPAVKTSQQFGGFYIVDVADRQAAVELAGKIPLYGDGSVEVRPLVGE